MDLTATPPQRELISLYEALGYPQPWDLSGLPFLEGPFYVPITILDNATTETALDGSDFAAKDRRWETVFGTTDNPDVVIDIRAVRVVLETTLDTAANLHLVLQNFYLKHTRAGVTRYTPPLFDAFETLPTSAAMAGTEGTPDGFDKHFFLGPVEPLALEAPILLRLRTDTLHYAVQDPVNTIADLKATLVVYGLAYNSLDLGMPRRVPVDVALRNGTLGGFRAGTHAATRNLSIPGSRRPHFARSGGGGR